MKTIREEGSISDRFLFPRVVGSASILSLEGSVALDFRPILLHSVLKKSWQEPSSITDARETRSISYRELDARSRRIFQSSPLSTLSK